MPFPPITLQLNSLKNMPLHDEGTIGKSMHDFPLLGLRATPLLVHLDLSCVWTDATRVGKVDGYL